MRRTAAPWLLLSPALVLLAVLLLWPLIRVLNLSLQDYELRNLLQGTNDYIGLDNYVQVLTDPFLWKTVLPNTVGFALEIGRESCREGRVVEGDGRLLD